MSGHACEITYCRKCHLDRIHEWKDRVVDLERQLAEAQGKLAMLTEAGVTDYSKLTGANRVDCHFCNGVWRTEEPAKHKSMCPLAPHSAQGGE